MAIQLLRPSQRACLPSWLLLCLCPIMCRNGKVVKKGLWEEGVRAARNGERDFSVLLFLQSPCLDGQTGDPRKQLLRSYLVLPLEASLDGFLFNGSHFRFRLRCRFCLGGEDGHLLLLRLCGFIPPQLRRSPPSLLFLLCGSELRDQVVQFAELEKLRKGTRVGARRKALQPNL